LRDADAPSGRSGRGLALMFAATIGFSLMHAAIRHLSGQLHPFEMAFFRNVFGLLVMGPILLRYGLAPLRTARFPLHSLRAILNLVAMLCFFYALSITPLADVAALSFMAPLFATVLAVLVLGEIVRIHRWSAILFGFAGAFVAIRPGFEDVGLGPVLLLAQAAVWGATLIVIKILCRTESSVTIAAYTVLLMIPLSAGPALMHWQTPTLEQLAWLALIGVLGTIAQMLMTQALKETEATLVLSLDFFKLVWATMLGYWLFGEVPDEFTWIGGVMIFASATYIAYREARLRKMG